MLYFAGLPDVADTSNFITAVNVNWMVQISALSLSKYWNKNTKASILDSMMPSIKIYDHRAFIRFSSNQTMVGKFFIICENYFVHVSGHRVFDQQLERYLVNSHKKQSQLACWAFLLDFGGLNFSSLPLAINFQLLLIFKCVLLRYKLFLYFKNG